MLAMLMIFIYLCTVYIYHFHTFIARRCVWKCNCFSRSIHMV